MPTESTFLFAGLLFLAAALGYVFARFGDDDEEDAEESARTNFLRGFRYLLSDESDRAVDAFTGANDLSDEAMETQLALGTLFRRRGEIERAIRLHQNLVDRQTSTVAQREAASFALAEDYLGAGLFDRAEELFVRLRDSRVHGEEALRHLLRICEVTRDWDRAVDLCAELNRRSPGTVNREQLAHYYCELAEQARRDGDLDIASQMLSQAAVIEPNKPRTVLIQADLDAVAGRSSVAIAALARLAEERADLLGEVLPRLLALMKGDPDGQQVAGILARIAATPSGLKGLALAIIRDASISDPLLLDYLALYLGRQPALGGLVGAEPAATRESLAGVQRLRPLLHRIVTAGSRFQCRNCGYGTAVMHWQCPGCRSWDTVQPGKPGLLEGVLS